MSRPIVTADVPIAYGAMVLVRGCRASLAAPALVNARVVSRPVWLGENELIPPRRSFAVEMLVQEPDLQAIADGPIMDPSQRFLPLGRLSWPETKAREAAQILDDAG